MIFAYLRTSVQKKNKISIEMQLAAIKEKAADLQLPELQESQVFVDRGVSGAKLQERKGLQELSKYSVNHPRSEVRYWCIALIG